MPRPIKAHVLIRFHVGRDRSAQLRAAIKNKGMVRRNAAHEKVVDLTFRKDRGKPPVRDKPPGGRPPVGMPAGMRDA